MIDYDIYSQPHRVKAHITSHGSIELIRSDQERNRVGHFLSVQGNRSSTLGLLQKKEKDTKYISKYIANGSALKLASTRTFWELHRLVPESATEKYSE
jgi:hypothetical protein